MHIFQSALQLNLNSFHCTEKLQQSNRDKMGEKGGIDLTNVFEAV